jgi:H+/Cl- antiporter ClcA
MFKLARRQPSVETEQSNYRLMYISLLAAAIGIAVGFVAYLLFNLIGFFTNLFFFGRIAFNIPGLQDNHLGLGVIVVTVLGGLVVGLMAKYGSEKIKGHGIPEAMEAVLFNRSKIAPRVAVLKPLSAALAIGTGGPFGAEGPIIQTGGAVGSIIGQFIRTTAAERKVLLACGAAAGMAATFNTPIAAVILAIELLLFEFKSRSFIPLVIASTLSTGVHFLLMGQGPIFSVGPLDFGIPSGLPFYLVLGVLCGGVAVGFSKALYWVEDQFERLPIDPMWWPAVAGVLLGVIGLFVPRVLGVGYNTISDILNNNLPLTLLLVIMVCKAVALVVTLGSGTSGGLLAPMFMVSAALGGAFALIVNQIFPGAHLDPGAYALVAMAAVFGSASRATFTFIIFAFEITRDYNAILPLMLVSVIADGIALQFMSSSIMTEKLARRGLRVRQDYEVDAADMVPVSTVMSTDEATVPQTMTVAEVIDRINRHDPELTRHQALLIVDEQRALRGLITRGDLIKAIREGNTDKPVIDVGAVDLVVAYPNDSVREAMLAMLQNDIGRLPVVDPNEPTKILGYLSRGGVMAAHLNRLKEEQEIEAGWAHRLPTFGLSAFNRRKPMSHEIDGG